MQKKLFIFCFAYNAFLLPQLFYGKKKKKKEKNNIKEKYMRMWEVKKAINRVTFTRNYQY